MKITNRVYQFKISLKEVSPLIWRRIHVPTVYSFWDLHVAIQDAMGWLDYHLHQFSIKRPHARKAKLIGIPDDSGFLGDIEILPGWEVDLARYFTDLGVKSRYEYDFGDGWEHDILLEGLLIKEKGIKYPRCIAGEGKCPPEDCGGPIGYSQFLEAVLDPMHEEHKAMLEWYGSDYYTFDFNPENVHFDNPKKRWKKAFS
ncbi:MAG: plasmid pRiA4b ORF-3 family protein [Desulfobacterales bacterium]|nr:plasmid pRiA4b ORF-3 family protein [Desulfobacterales bacterium]